jgi:hypothetical protein
MEPASVLPPSDRRRSSVPHVDVTYFDPEGVNDLRRQLSNGSHESKGAPLSRTTTRTGETLPVSEPFNFEKVLRQIIQR